ALTQRERVVSLRDVYLPKATQVRDTVEYAYRRGGQSLLDFLDAQRSYRETALTHLQALGASLSALYQLEADIGGPLDKGNAGKLSVDFYRTCRDETFRSLSATR